jgi:hypothetical protein
MDRIADFIGDIADVESSRDAMTLRRKSRDSHAVSPLLRKSLEGKLADVVVRPKSKAEILRVVAAAVKHRIPITARGGGTANYGQSVPLHGGILLDMTSVAGVVWTRPGAVRALAGTIIADIDDAARAIGWELRMHPSTKDTATIGGFVAGGTGGIGSAGWGVLRDRGNIAGLEVITAEDTPRLIELRGQDTNLVHHAYGANCIISEVEMPLAPAFPWIEAIVAFPDYIQTVRFGVAVGMTIGIVKKLLSVQEWPTPRLMRPLGTLVPDGHSMISCLIWDQSMEDFRELGAEFGGKIVSVAPEGQGPYEIPLYEMAFGHALLQCQRSEPRRAAIEGFFHADDLAALIERVHRKLGGVGPMRMELRRWGSRLAGSGSPFFLFESEEQMAGIVRLMQSGGASVANSHASNVRTVGKKEVTDRDIEFKLASDPYGLLNPGRFEADSAADHAPGSRLPTDSWLARRVLIETHAPHESAAI